MALGHGRVHDDGNGEKLLRLKLSHIGLKAFLLFLLK
jgi:hypothetical protein